MNQLTIALDELWRKLAAYKIVEGARPGISSVDSPWYVKILLAFSGWLAALFLMGFIGVAFAFAFKSTAMSLSFGCILIGIAYFLLRRPNNEFLAHLALAISLAGQGLITWGILEPLHESVQLCAMLIGTFQLVLTVIMPNFIHRVFSSFATSCALYIGFVFFVTDGYYFSPVAEAAIISIISFAMSWLWINEFRFAKKHAMISAAAYGLTLSLLALKTISVIGLYRYAGVSVIADGSFSMREWLGEIFLIGVLIWVVIHIVRGMRNAPPRVIQVALTGTLIIGLVSVKAPGITIGLLIMLLGFNSRNRILSSLGVVALIGYISRYYYMLDQTLASKASTLLALGVVLLGIRFLLIRIANAKTSNVGVR